jgi:hypothetical protein
MTVSMVLVATRIRDPYWPLAERQGWLRSRTVNLTLARVLPGLGIALP